LQHLEAICVSPLFKVTAAPGFCERCFARGQGASDSSLLAAHALTVRNAYD